MFSPVNNSWPQAGLVSHSSPSYSTHPSPNDHVRNAHYLSGQGYVHGLDDGRAGHVPAHGHYASTPQSYNSSQYTSPTVEGTYIMRNGNPYPSFGNSQHAYPSTFNGAVIGPLVDRRNSLDVQYNDASSASYAAAGYPMANNSAAHSKGNHANMLASHHVFPDYLNLPAEYRKKGASVHHGPHRSRRNSVNTSPYNSATPRRQSRTHKELAVPPFLHLDNDPYSIMHPKGTDLNGPTNHMRVPQKVFVDELEPSRGGAHRDPSITFQNRKFHEYGVRVSSVIEQADPDIVGARDKVFKGLVYKEIKLRLIWPGYYDFPFEKRIKTLNGEIDRQTLLLCVANVVLDYIKFIQAKKIPCDDGLETWKLGGKIGGLSGNELFITGLIHRGGSNWQPEIWSPIFAA